MREKEIVVIQKKKPFPNVSPNTGVSRGKRSAIDDKHWDFLDEIDAPSWIDLTLECQSGYSDKDDEWFHVTHPFHQCSSRQWISAFCNSSMDGMHWELDIPEISSPKLPTSVSKSRRKDCRMGHRVQGNQMVNQHPVKNLKKKSSFVSSESTRMTGSKTSKGSTTELAISSSYSRGKSSFTENSGQRDIRIVHPVDDQIFSSNSNVFGKGESSSSSTITSEGSGQQPQNSLEVSSHAFGQTRGFLSALKVSLRKSCVTRQASRVEVPNGRLSECPKSSFSKTSVGSSTHPCYDEKHLTARDNKDMTPDGRSLRILVEPNHKAHEAKLPNAHGVRPHYTVSNPKLRSQSSKSPSINQGNAKVKQQKLQANVLVPLDVYKHYPPAAATKVKEKVVPSRSGRIPDGGKENLPGKVAPSQKSSTRSTLQVQKARMPEKCSKENPPGKAAPTQKSSTRSTMQVPEARIPEKSGKENPPGTAAPSQKSSTRSTMRVQKARVPEKSGKENPPGKAAPSRKSSTRSTMQVQRVASRVPEKSVRTTVVPKERRINDVSKGKKTGTTIPEKVYFR